MDILYTLILSVIISIINVVCAVQSAYRFYSQEKTELKSQIFQAWKIMESGLGPGGESWKINQIVATFLIRVHQNQSGVRSHSGSLSTPPVL